MNTIKYVKAVHGLTKEEYGETPILTCDDVNQILDRKLQILNSAVDRLERECREYRKRVEDLQQNRKWLWENVDVIKKFLVGDIEKAVGLMQEYSENNHNVLGGLDAAWKTRLRLEKLPESCREVFGNVIMDCLAPKLETFGRQIGRLELQIEHVDKACEEMSQRGESLAFELNECRNLAHNRMSRVSLFRRIIALFKRKDTTSVALEEV